MILLILKDFTTSSITNWGKNRKLTIRLQVGFQKLKSEFQSDVEFIINGIEAECSSIVDWSNFTFETPTKKIR
jgi:hypothetical protein